jgi:hypothetical protein
MNLPFGSRDDHGEAAWIQGLEIRVDGGSIIDQVLLFAAL